MSVSSEPVHRPFIFLATHSPGAPTSAAAQLGSGDVPAPRAHSSPRGQAVRYLTRVTQRSEAGPCELQRAHRHMRPRACHQPQNGPSCPFPSPAPRLPLHTVSRGLCIFQIHGRLSCLALVTPCVAVALLPLGHIPSGRPEFV